MIDFIIRRLIMTVFLALALVAVVFFMLRTIVPGDPAQLLAGENASPETIAQIRENLGLNKPLYEQFGIFLVNMLHGDLGKSTMTHEDVSSRVGKALPVTLGLTLICFTYTMVLGVSVGIMTAYWHDTWLDNLMRVVTVGGASLPTFWLGLMLILVFSVWLGVLPVQGGVTFKGLILPAITLGTGSAAFLARLVRSSMLEVLNSDYVRTARAKGLKENKVILKHALRNALIPIITVAGFQIGGLLGGATVTEQIFGLSGVGSMVINSIFNRDYPLVQGSVLFIGLVYLFVNLFVDILYAYVDPRIRYD